MSEKVPAVHVEAPPVFCYEAGLEEGCTHDFRDAPYPTPELPAPTPMQSMSLHTSVRVPTTLRLYCRRCGGYRVWPEESGVYRREVSG